MEHLPPKAHVAIKTAASMKIPRIAPHDLRFNP
jgi:hypothetical protein